MLGVLIPALNEEENIHKVLEGLFSAGIAPENIFVLNNNSVDNTKIIAKQFSCNVIDINSPGYSKTLKAGLRFLKDNKYTQFLIVDGDNEIDATSVNKIIKLSDQYRLCCGFRSNPKRLGEKIVNAFFKKKYGVFDFMCGLKLGYVEDFNERSSIDFGIDLLVLSHIKSESILNLEIKLNSREGSRLGNNIKVNFMLIMSLLMYILRMRILK